MNKNLYTGLENFKEQLKKDLNFEQLINLFGGLKVLEYRSIEQHENELQYKVQDLIVELEDKIKNKR